MAERQATWLKDGVATGAVEQRLAATSMIARPGIDGPNDLAVTAPGGANVAIAIGGAWIARTAAFQGAEHVVNDSVVTRALAATAAGVSRRDLIIARITATGWALEVVQGVAAVTPADAAQPADSILLARVIVPASTSVITTGMIADLRVQYALANGAVMTVPNAASRPIGVAKGTFIYQLDNTRTYVWNGSAWWLIGTLSAEAAPCNGMGIFAGAGGWGSDAANPGRQQISNGWLNAYGMSVCVTAGTYLDSPSGIGLTSGPAPLLAYPQGARPAWANTAGGGDGSGDPGALGQIIGTWHLRTAADGRVGGLLRYGSNYGPVAIFQQMSGANYNYQSAVGDRVAYNFSYGVI